MRSYLTLPALVSLLPLSAQDPGAQAMKTWLSTQVSGLQAWALLVRGKEPSDVWWRRDEGLLRLVADRDLAIHNLDKDKGEALGELRGWGPGPRWLLVSEDGRRTEEGQGIPNGDAVCALLRGLGHPPRWEAREAFLREHVTHGDALDERLRSALTLARQRFAVLAEEGKVRKGRILLEPGPKAEVADAAFLELAETLERLADLPDGWRISNLWFLSIALNGLDAAASPRLRSALVRLQTQALEAWRNSPGAISSLDPNSASPGGFGDLWNLAEGILRPDQTPVPPLLEPSPMRAWPPPDLHQMVTLRTMLARDWKGFLTALPELEPKSPACPMTQAQWDAFYPSKSSVAVHTFLAHAFQNQWDLARGDLQEARRWAGKGWKDYQAVLKVFLWDDTSEAMAAPVGMPRLTPPSDIQDLLLRDPESDPQNPCPIVPIRMVLLGTPAWASQWKELAGTAPLAPWGPDELRWESATQADETLLAHLEARPAWAALKGERTILALGQDLPEPRALAAQLAGGGMTRLQRMDAFIRQHPDHLDARRDRWSLVQPRLPNPSLERRAAQDAARARIPVAAKPEDPWSPDPAIWGPEADRMLPDLEDTLGRWPSNAQLWKTWVAWNALRPKPRSPHAMATDMTVWGSRSRWAARLPRELHDAIAGELRQRKRFALMRDWFQAAWDGLRTQEDDPDGSRQANLEVILSHLKESLVTLGQRELLRELDRQRRDMEAPRQE